MKNHVHYSRLLLQKDKYILSYMRNNKHLVSVEDCYNEILEKRKVQLKIFDKLRKIYYELENINQFGIYLVSKGIYKKVNSIHNFFSVSTISKYRLLPKEKIDRNLAIIEAYEGFKNDNRQPN